MAPDKIVLLTLPSDQGDILKDYIEWYLDLGVDLILALDCDSSDNSHKILNRFSDRGKVQWSLMPSKHYLNFQPAETLAKMAIEQCGADWIIMCDVDEFLCSQGDDLRTILNRAAANNITAISVPCFNMTGQPVVAPGRITETQTLRIDRSVKETGEQQLSGDIPVPYIFIGHPPKTIVRASAFVEYGPGTHEVITSAGDTKDLPELRFLHYPIRGYDKFQTKIANVVSVFENNPHLEPWFGWHWRRWIRLNQAGRLREEYENQFVSPARAEELIRDGVCSLDETIANWSKTRNKNQWRGPGFFQKIKSLLNRQGL